MSAKTSLDSIVREIILEKGYAKHGYIQLLSHGLSCLKELDMDSTGRVKSVTLFPDEYSQAPLPCDYVDWVRIGQPRGEYFMQFGPSNKLHRGTLSQNGQYQGRAVAAWDSAYVMDWYSRHAYAGQPNFGGNGTRGDEFMILEDRIQFKLGYGTGSEVTMDYIYYDQTSASASIHPYADSTVKAYMEYKYLLSFPKVTPYEKAEAKRNYESQRTILDRRLNDLTPDVMRRLLVRRFSLVK